MGKLVGRVVDLTIVPYREWLREVKDLLELQYGRASEIDRGNLFYRRKLAVERSHPTSASRQWLGATASGSVLGARGDKIAN